MTSVDPKEKSEYKKFKKWVKGTVLNILVAVSFLEKLLHLQCLEEQSPIAQSPILISAD